MKRRSNSNATSTLGLALAAALPCLAAPTAANAAPPAENETKTNARAEESRRYSARGRGDRRDKWIHRWAPVRNMWEFGIYGGVWFPSKHLELFGPTESGSGAGNQRLNTVAPDVGLRAAYFPLRFLGVEIEGGVMPTKTKSSDVNATAWALRGHVIGQLGLWSVTPFILAGAGLVGMDSASPPRGIGKDQDVAIHFGAGMKVFINRWVMLRLDVRDVVSNRAGVGEGLTSSPEILLGLSFTLRSKKKKSRPRDDDRDGDRILDKDDFCVDVYGPPPRGCPQVCIDDNDGDGLDNTEDSCIDDPETRNGFEDGDGCPDEVPPELSQIAGIMEGIQFDTDKDHIKSSSQTNIDNASAVMKKYPSIRVRVIGHTDSQGGYKHNIDLSQRRAASVKRAMVEDGVEESRIETAGVGPDQPVDTNETAEGRAKNRRIEFIILEGTAEQTVKKRGTKPPKKDDPPVEPTPEPTPEPAADAAKPVEPTAPK